jgi:hypothetical protein
LRQKAESAEVEVPHQPASPPVLVEAKLSQPAPIPVTPPTPEPPLPVSPPAAPPDAAPPAARSDAPPAAPLTPPERVANVVTLQAGTLLNVRIGETLSTRRSRPGDNFLATLNEPLVIDNWVIAEKGSRVEGRVVDSDASGRMRGTAYLSVELVRINTADGQRVRIHTESIDRKTKASPGEDAAKVVVGAALGAAIGAAAGGGKGAGIGAGVGAAAGAGDVLLTHSKPAEFAVETRLSFRVTDAVEITEQRRE